VLIVNAEGGIEMNLGIDGKIALVTAASRGLGRGCAQQLAAEQCRVAICSRDGNTAKQAAVEIAAQTGAEVLGFGADVSRAEEISDLLEQVRQSLGDPEILLTNTGGPAVFCEQPSECKVLPLTLDSGSFQE
jgi:3-oxoacyl-[acyl-carrier protein] reductase